MHLVEEHRVLGLGHLGLRSVVLVVEAQAADDAHLLSRERREEREPA